MAIQSKEISRRDFLRVGLVGLGLAAVGGAAKTIDILSGPNPISSSAAAREKTSGKMLAKEVTIKAGDLSFVINSDRFQNREDFTRVTDETGFVSQKYQDAFGPPLKRRKVLVADKVFDPQHKERPYGAYSFVDHNIFSDQEFQGNIFLSEDKIRGDGLKESLGCEIAHFWDWPNPEKKLPLSLQVRNSYREQFVGMAAIDEQLMSGLVANSEGPNDWHFSLAAHSKFPGILRFWGEETRNNSNISEKDLLQMTERKYGEQFLTWWKDINRVPTKVDKGSIRHLDGEEYVALNDSSGDIFPRPFGGFGVKSVKVGQDNWQVLQRTGQMFINEPAYSTP